jgi:hypothetical protein
LTISGGGYDPKKKVEELNAQFLVATNPSKMGAANAEYGMTIATTPYKIGAANSEYGMTIATTPYKTQEQIANSQLNTAQFQSGLRLQPIQEKADYGGLRNKSFAQDDAYAGGIVDSGVKQLQRNTFARGIERELKRMEAGNFEHPDKARGVKYAEGQFDTAEKRQDRIDYLRELLAAQKAGMAANPYQYQAPAPNIPFDNGTKKGYYK